MSWDQSLLPLISTPWEQATETVSAGRYPLEWDVLRSLQKADEIPEDKLPILAWAFSVDLWRADWSLEKRRSVVRQAVQDHARKGTIAGVRRYLEIVDAELVHHLAPPQAVFASDTLDKAGMDAWLSRMPQLRIYLRRRQGTDPGYAFADVDYVGETGQPSDPRGYVGFDGGRRLYGRHPVYWDAGESTDLEAFQEITIRQDRRSVQVERVSLQGTGGYCFTDVDCSEAAYYDHDVTQPALVTVRLDGSYVHQESILALQAIQPGLAAIDPRYERVSEIGFAGPAGFAGDFFDRGWFYQPDDGAWLLYDRVYLHDPARAAPLVDALSFYDHARLGMPAFTFEAMVDATREAPRPFAFEGDWLDDTYLADEDQQHLSDALDAVALAKAYRDKALVTFETTRPRTWGDGLPMTGGARIWDRLPAAL